jgi:phenylalanyl-tRNA synthetase beta chain
LKDPGNLAVELLNPATAEYQLVRTSLLPGILKTVASNKKSPLPWKVFEVGDVCLQDPKAARRARNERRVCALYANKTSGFELIHGLLDRLMLMLNVPLIEFKDQQQQSKVGYSINPSDLATYFPGRQAQIFYKNQIVGSFGIVHPEVLSHFEIGYPTSMFEFNLEPFL